MNVYVVRTRDTREYVEPIMDDGTGPSFEYLPIAPVVAETRGQAKRLFLAEFSGRSYSGVYSDDWNELRVRVLARDVDRLAGVYEEDGPLWNLVADLDAGESASVVVEEVA